MVTVSYNSRYRLEWGVRTVQWIIPCDLNYYDAISAFSSLKTIDWRQNNRYAVGDTVFVYASVPYQKIMFKTKVLAVDLMYEDTIDDFAFWKVPVDEREKEKKKSSRYVRLQLIKFLECDDLGLEHLMEQGLKKAPQGAVKCQNDKLQLGEYIEKCFAQDTLNDKSDVIEEDDYYEGSSVEVQLNRYERSIEAREKCIEFHGCHCKICGFDFEEVYGEAGRGFIHVHHIVPISEVGEEYLVDYQKDLIPVCPNCHAIIHRRREPYTVQEVKQLLQNRRYG